MKKILSITLGLILVFSMIAALAINTSAAADAQVLRQYDRASDADILFYAEFNSEVYQTNDCAKTNLEYEISEDGREIAIESTYDAVKEYNYFGAPIEALEVPKDAKVTMSFKIKVSEGEENKIGLGGWFVDDSSDITKWVVYNEYGLWDKEVRICQTSTGKSAYTPNIANATIDEDGFITVKYEFDGSKAQDRKMTTFFLQDGAWVENNTFKLDIGKATIADHLGIAIYSHYTTIDATIKDVKFFKGLGLTAEQIAITENTTNEVEPTEATTRAPIVPKTTVAKTTVAPADATTAASSESGCGGSLALATVAVVPAIAAVAFVCTKKRED